MQAGVMQVVDHSGDSVSHGHEGQHQTAQGLLPATVRVLAYFPRAAAKLHADRGKSSETNLGVVQSMRHGLPMPAPSTIAQIGAVPVPLARPGSPSRALAAFSASSSLSPSSATSPSSVSPSPSPSISPSISRDSSRATASCCTWL